MPEWTSISLEKGVKERFEKYLKKRESWNKGITRLLDEIEYSRELRKKYRLK